MSTTLVFGPVALDTIRFAGGVVHQRVLGGSASYFSIAAARFAPTRLVSVIGSDFPPEYLELLKNLSIDLAGLQMVPGGPTFFWDGEYLPDMNQRITHRLELGVFQGFSPELPKDWENSGIVFCANNDPVVQLPVLKSCSKARLAVMDTMDFWIVNRRKELLEALKLADLLFLNDHEARLLTEKSSLIDAARNILTLGPKRVIVKRGEYGALMLGPHGPFALPALPLSDAVDPTGAGDTFAGAFVGCLAAGGRLDESHYRRACVAGTVAASFVCQGIGVKSLLDATAEDFTERVREFQALVHCPSDPA